MADNNHSNRVNKRKKNKKRNQSPCKNIALQAIVTIQSKDRFGERTPKIEQWLAALSATEKAVVFENLGKVSVEEAVVLIKQIISKDADQMRSHTDLLGLLYSQESTEQFQLLVLSIENDGQVGAEKARFLDEWLASLTSAQASAFRVNLSKMEKESADQVLTWLAKLATNDQRTERAQARGLIPKN